MPVDSGQYATLLAELRAGFDAGLTRPLDWRHRQLAALERMLRENEERIADALAEDLGKPAQEVLLGETALLFAEIGYARKRLRRWVRQRRVSTPVLAQPGRSWVQPEPLGVVLI